MAITPAQSQLQSHKLQLQVRSHVIGVIKKQSQLQYLDKLKILSTEL